MNDILCWLTATLLMTALLWVPYILNAFAGVGLNRVFVHPEQVVLSPWAARAKRAHSNAVENLVVFAPLVLIALYLLTVHTDLQATHAHCVAMIVSIYFWARLIHFVTYTAGIPYLRTLAFLTGCGAQVYLAICILKIIHT